MKKIFSLFVIVLMGAFSTIATAQTTDNLLNIAGVVPDTNGKTTYFVKNVGTGLHMSYGGEFGTHCIETQAAHPIVVETNGDGTVALGSLTGYLASNNTYMDKNKTASKWTLEAVPGKTNQYYLVGDGGNLLTSLGHSAGVLSMEAKEGNAMQRWVFLTEANIKEYKMPNASATVPFDVTPFIKGAAFDLADGETNTNQDETVTRPSIFGSTLYNSAWTNYTANAKYIWHCGYRSDVAAAYNYCGIINGSASALTITYKMTLPKGTYHFSFEAFYKYMKVVETYSWGSLKSTTTSDNGTMAATISVAGVSNSLESYGSDNSIYDNGESVAEIFRDNDTYKHHGTFYLASNQEVSIVISKPATTKTSNDKNILGNGNVTSYPSQIYVDDFTLFYYGTEEIADENISHNAMFADYLLANIEERTEGFCQEAKDACMAVIGNVDEISTRQQYYEALAKLDKAEEAAENVQNTLVGVGIVNPSFENGMTGWTYQHRYTPEGEAFWGDFGAFDYATEGMDGSYVFNNYAWPTIWWNSQSHSPVSQDVDVPNGFYRLTALVASDDNRKVFVVGEDYYNGAQAVGPGAFVEVSTDFLVEDGTATIKACASNTNIDFGAHYWPDGGWWYKADNFRMVRLGDLAHGRLKLAIDKAKTAALNVDLTQYESLYNQAELTEAAANTAVEEIYQKLQTAAKAQTTAGADMTCAIANHSFENGNYNGWTLNGSGHDVRVASQNDPGFAALDADGRFLFNSWNDANATAGIEQTITDLPDGTYRLTVSVTSHADWEVEVFANDENATVVADDVTRFKTVKVKFDVTDGTATIGVVGNRFYKADNFRLEYLADDHLQLNQTATAIEELNETFNQVTINRALNVVSGEEKSYWSSFVVPFDMDVRNGWEVKKLASSEYNEETGNITLIFEDADAIEAGVPYMVRVSSNVSSIVEENVYVNTAVPTIVETDYVQFIGTYTRGTIPTGSYFINSNKFYHSVNAEKPDWISGFRAYFTVKENVEAKSISYRFGDEETTAIDNMESTANSQQSIVIYDLMGRRVENPTQGVYIVNGKKVVIR